MTIHVRKAVPGDYEAVERIMKQAQELHAGLRPDIYVHADPVITPEAFAERLDHQVWWAAETDGRITGIMEIYRRRYRPPLLAEREVLYIAAIAVDEAFRTRGIGHALLEKAKDLCRESGLDGIELQVNVRNTDAVHLYESFGFEPESVNMELLKEKF